MNLSPGKKGEMMKLVSRLLLAGICMTSPCTVWADEFSDGLEAMNKNHYQEAFSFFEKAVEVGHVEAEYYLGFLYATGKGVQQNLARMYVDEGRDLPLDIEKAHYWFQKAAKQGHAKAHEDLKKLEKKYPQLQQ